jgi:hypothetical protein
MTMTDDLVKRMRSQDQCWSVSEAADRIETLTADFALQVQRTDEQRAAYGQALSVMEADNARLLADMRKIAKRGESIVWGRMLRAACNDMTAIAIAALNTGKEVMPVAQFNHTSDIGSGDQDAVAGAALDPDRLREDRDERQQLDREFGE